MAFGPFNAGTGGVDGAVESMILKDSVTGKHYAVLIEDGGLTLLEVAGDLEALDEVRLDTVTGTAYYIGVEDGVIVLEPVEENDNG